MNHCSSLIYLSTVTQLNNIHLNETCSLEIGSYLESKIHSWAQMASKVYVISGVVLDADNDGHRDSDASYSRYARHSCTICNAQ